MASWLPKVRVAACNVAPVFLDTAKTVQKTIGLIREAASNRADLVVFPETYIPAFPLWAAVAAPIDNHDFFCRLAQQSIHVDGPEMRSLQHACAQNRIFAHVGFNERSRASVGCLWNAAVVIGDDGRILNHARKMAPTFYEKLVWAAGDARGLAVVDSARCGRLGALICGENTNPLARWALIAQGEQLHLSTWPPVWPTRRLESPAGGGGKQYDNVAANRTRAAAHCFEAKCFGVLCSGVMDRAMRDEIVAHSPSAADTLDSLQQGSSLFLDPTGTRVGEEARGGEEAIVYADLDLNACVEPKQFHDLAGGYQRFDIFDLRVDRRRRGPDAVFTDGEDRGDVTAAADEEEEEKMPAAGLRGGGSDWVQGKESEEKRTRGQ